MYAEPAGDELTANPPKLASLIWICPPLNSTVPLLPLTRHRHRPFRAGDVERALSLAEADR
jgi:hypothetical protein